MSAVTFVNVSHTVARYLGANQLKEPRRWAWGLSRAEVATNLYKRGRLADGKGLVQRLDVHQRLVNGSVDGSQGLIECSRTHATLDKSEITYDLLNVFTYLSCLRL